MRKRDTILVHTFDQILIDAVSLPCSPKRTVRPRRKGSGLLLVLVVIIFFIFLASFIFFPFRFPLYLFTGASLSPYLVTLWCIWTLIYDSPNFHDSMFNMLLFNDPVRKPDYLVWRDEATNPAGDLPALFWQAECCKKINYSWQAG